ncbi:carboxylesterase/lipase family protein [Marinimicrobium sp. LS-A18]|uniref:carboxylesterase/lipase family protein n=1 Tax=Marinimicrobium sp. LS-A18 TaxID=1381596 RepID=UPI000464BC43|nr:carboxylesterase family protein [Marinimicrobium sp. LS-A18]
MKIKFSVLIKAASLALVATSLSVNAAPELVREVEGGKVKGEVEQNVLSYKGIPFAQPPVADHRWRKPQPVASWEGVKDATSYASDCMQIPFPSDAAPLGTEPSEDCLYLNIWRPAESAEKLPVLVWIYGGGFVNGGSSPDVYDGSAFASQGLVFVSFNYRLGRFGYFAHPALEEAGEGLGGNFGLMDQHAALRWVQDNIEQFGGDPDQVTIMGESAGGMAVTHLMGSPAAEGLFHRAIVMSGGGRTGGQTRDIREDQPDMPSASTIGVNFAESKGISGSGEEALAKLRGLSPEEVAGDLNLATLFYGDEESKRTWTGPFKDGVTLLAGNEELFRRGEHGKVPLMVGATSADVGFSSAETKEELFKQFGRDERRARKAFDPTGETPLRQLGMTVGAMQFMVEPARYLAREVTESGEKAWHYRFSYVALSKRDEWSGAPHATEIPFAFSTLEAKYGVDLMPQDQATAKLMNAYFGNFARTGTPNSAGIPEWSEYAPRKKNLLEFTMNELVSEGADPWREQLDLIEKQAEQ